MNHPNIADERAQNGTQERTFAALLALYSLVLMPILRANRYCNDDLKRSLFGRTGWDSNGRPLTTLVMKLLQSYDHALVDISPLTQIGAVLVLSWAGTLLAKRFCLRPWWLGALLTFPLGAQPFFLENLSYKFDSFTMSVAVLLSVWPICWIPATAKARWQGILALFAGLCFYQPAFNIFLVLACVEFVIVQIETRDFAAALRLSRERVFQAVVGFGLYEIIVGIHVNGWVKERAQPISSWHDVQHVVVTVQNFARFIGDSFGVQWWRYFGPLLLAFAIISWAATLRITWQTRKQSRASFAVFNMLANLLLPLIALLAVLGPLLVLIDPPIVPRILVGIGGLLAGGLIVTYCAFRAISWPSTLPAGAAIMLAVGMSTFASAYGNAAGEQKAFEDHIAVTLADDFAELRATRGVQRYLIDGSAGLSPMASHIATEFPLVKALIPPFLNGEDLFHTHVFLLFYMPNAIDYRDNKEPGWKSQIESTIARANLEPVVMTRQTYIVRMLGDIAVIHLLPANGPSVHRDDEGHLVGAKGPSAAAEPR